MIAILISTTVIITKNSPADDRYSVLGRDSGNYPVGGRCYDPLITATIVIAQIPPVDDRYSVL